LNMPLPKVVSGPACLPAGLADTVRVAAVLASAESTSKVDLIRAYLNHGPASEARIGGSGGSPPGKRGRPPGKHCGPPGR
jgi:hypothetical protein